MWTILSDSYGDKAWEMLADMYKNGRINYSKADKHFRYIMDHWGYVEVLRTVKTWLKNIPLMDPRKLETYDEFADRYTDIVENNKSENWEVWPKPENFDIK